MNSAGMCLELANALSASSPQVALNFAPSRSINEKRLAGERPVTNARAVWDEGVSFVRVSAGPNEGEIIEVRNTAAKTAIACEITSLTTPATDP